MYINTFFFGRKVSHPARFARKTQIIRSKECEIEKLKCMLFLFIITRSTQVIRFLLADPNILEVSLTNYI